jgi:glycogen synthase
MDSLDKEFMPYQESLELKELDFNEPCLAQWDEMELYPLQQGGESAYFETNKNSRLSFNTMAPTFSQCFRWFREKCKLSGITSHCSFEIWDLKTEECIVEVYPISSFDEAQLACLKKLIEIVKTK